MSGKTMEAIVSFTGVISPELQKTMQEAEGHVSKLAKTLKKGAIAGAIAAIPVMTGKAVADAGKYLSALGSDWKKTMNQLSASTGTTGEELAALGESAQEVYSQNFGDSLADVTAGLAAVKQNSGLVGENLEKATMSAFALRDTFTYEISESSRTAAALMKNFGITSEEAYGIIATGAQNGADKNGDLLDTLNEYSGQYAALGLSADQFLDSLISGADAGLFSIDKVGDAVKEFNIRSKDNSASSAEAFNSLGLNADEMFNAFAAGGDAAQAAFFDTVESLNSLGDPLKKNQIGVALFGSQFEDLEAGILPVLSGIENAAYDGEKALQKINDVKYNDLGSAFQQIRRTAEVSLLPMASKIADSMTALSPMIQDAFDEISPVIIDTVDECMPFVEDFLVGMGDVLKDVLPMIAGLAKGLLPVLTQLVSRLLPPLLELAKKIIPPLMQVVEAILPPISSILSSILPMLTQIISSVLPVMTQLITSLLPVISPLLESAMQIVNDVIMPLVPPLMQIVEALLPTLTSVLSGILPILSPILKILEPIADVLSTIVGWISKVVGWVADGLGWIVGLFTGGNKTPEGYATGGFTSGPSIAGEDPRYPTEAVISFNPAYRSQNLAYWARAGQLLGASDDNYESLNGGTSMSVVYDLSGLSFSPQIAVSGDNDEDALIRKLRDMEPEFVDFVLEALNRREGCAYVTADSRLY